MIHYNSLSSFPNFSSPFDLVYIFVALADDSILLLKRALVRGCVPDPTRTQWGELTPILGYGSGRYLVTPTPPIFTFSPT